jgi:hypothetical protein
MLSQAAARNLGWKIKACLKADCLKCAATTASNVEGCLAAGEYIKAWRHLKGWYRLAEDQAPKPCPETSAKQTNKRIQLYTAVHPPRWAMHFSVDPSDVPDAAPTDSELRAVMGNLRNGRAVGTTGMKAEHLKEWLTDIKRKETEDGVEGIGCGARVGGTLDYIPNPTLRLIKQRVFTLMSAFLSSTNVGIVCDPSIEFVIKRP